MRKTAFARAALWIIACFLLSYILPGRTAPPQRVHSKSSTTELIETLQDTNNDDQQRLAAAGYLRNRGQEAIPAMTQALSDPNREIRNTAVVLLAQSDVSLTEAEAKAVLPTFIGALQDGDSRVTIAACQLSEKIEPKPTQMVLALIDACNHKDRRVRAAAMTVFQNMNAAAIPALIEGLQSGDTEICLAATRILGSQGTKAKAAAADLQVTLTDQNVEVRMASMRSLSQIIGSDAIPALTECLSDPNSMARAEAIQVLSTFGPKAGTVLSAANGSSQ